MSVFRLFFIIMLFLSSTLFASVGKVSLLKGEATVERNSIMSALKNGATLEEKDTIKTSKDSQIQLIFEDKTVITLGGESDFKIEEYLNDASNSKAKFKFNQGAFKTITGSIGKNAPQNFTMETKTSTIGIRGTITAGDIPPPPPPNTPPLPEFIYCLDGTIFVALFISPDLPVLVPRGSFTQIITPTTQPTPAVPFRPYDLERIQQVLGGTPPPEPLGTPTQGGGNTPPTGNPGSGNDAPPPPTPPAPSGGTLTPQGFTPTVATDALQTNLQTATQDGVILNIAQDLNIPADTIMGQIQNQVCPTGTTGTYPNCRPSTCADSGQQGTYPNCGTCTALQTGTYPNCVNLTCPAGTTGTYPDCGTCTALQTGTYPNCVNLTCPAGTTGTYPDCGTCTALQSGTYPNCVNLTCPAGTTGTYPDCRALTCADSGQQGTYPNCGVCSAGTTGTYPNCQVATLTCADLGQEGIYPDCYTPQDHVGQDGMGDYYSTRGFVNLQNSIIASCPFGTTGTYPNCVPFSLVGLATSTYDHNVNGDISFSISDVFSIDVNSTYFSGAITLKADSSGSTRGSFDLNGTAGVAEGLNSFQNSIIQTQSSALNDYVSWGYWQSKTMDGNQSLIAGQNYWVAGKDATVAAQYLESIRYNSSAHYTYTGKVLGQVIDGGTSYFINPDTSNVQLKFAFGGGNNALYDNPDYSWIRFNANNKLWDIRPTLGTRTVIDGKFSDGLAGTVATSIVVTGAINGQFFGDTAQAVGGTFKASSTDTTLKALGVFKAVR